MPRRVRRKGQKDVARLVALTKVRCFEMSSGSASTTFCARTYFDRHNVVLALVAWIGTPLEPNAARLFQCCRLQD